MCFLIVFKNFVFWQNNVTLSLKKFSLYVLTILSSSAQALSFCLNSSVTVTSERTDQQLLLKLTGIEHTRPAGIPNCPADLQRSVTLIHMSCKLIYIIQYIAIFVSCLRMIQIVLPVLITPNEKTSSGDPSVFQAFKMVIIPFVVDIAVALLVFDEIVVWCLCTKLIKSVCSHFLIKKTTTIIITWVANKTCI